MPFYACSTTTRQRRGHIFLGEARDEYIQEGVKKALHLNCHVHEHLRCNQSQNHNNVLCFTEAGATSGQVL